MANPTRKGGKKGRKYNRNKVGCKRYKDEGRREKNKARKAARIQRGFRSVA